MTKADMDAITRQYEWELNHPLRHLLDPSNGAKRWESPGEWWASRIEDMINGKLMRTSPQVTGFDRAWPESLRVLGGLLDAARRFALRYGSEDQAKRVFNEIVALKRHHRAVVRGQRVPAGVRLSIGDGVAAFPIKPGR